MKGKNTIDHRSRKNPHSAEMYQERRQKKNASRPKQRWVGGESVAEGGHWERTTVNN
jgi:hypothetical protein